ncbi:BQ2448_7886 [Microbotryum intermedium]|uniref:BQ2448_7886 protein n=1 Tax=Microbotryum intermedium TaxID=269621 RepID=A0A238FNJ6_9BASI|nr:BQ2448_7886 [Microbotryum intermedium]
MDSWQIAAAHRFLLRSSSTPATKPTKYFSPTASGALIVIYSFLYQFTVGPVCYCLVAEIPSTRLRAKSVVLARTSYNIVGIINNIIFPRMLSPLAWNWNAKAGFFWGASCFLCTIRCFFRLPEPKGRTLY